MRLTDFPRPPNDTRIGVHWAPGVADAVGLAVVRSQWIPRLKEMGVTWVKMLHVGAVRVAEAFLDHRIMPIVRLYRPRPNSDDPSPGEGTLGREEIEALEALVAVGVRYFEFNNEPDLGGEWRTPMPPDPETAMRVVARNAIRDMETILNKGGLPAIPAVAVGSRWDLMGAIIAEGGQDLLGEGVWWAIHNYDLNHPLDYPDDPVNQEGRQLSPEEYQALGPEAWTGPTWGHRSLAFVNERRRQDANPGATVHEDPSGWRAYEYFAALSLHHLGFHIPILSTESGPMVGEDMDPRYPTTTPAIHAQKVVEMARVMMGTSERFDPAPDYYFCTAFWVLGDRALGAQGRWDAHAWFSDRWPGGRLPAVDALRNLPQRAWQPQGDAVLPPPQTGSRVWGRVGGGAGRLLRLQGRAYRATSVVQEDETFSFEGVPAGIYSLHVAGTEVTYTGVVIDGIHPVEVNLNLAPPNVALPPRRSAIRGQLLRGAGMVVHLIGEDATLRATVAPDESFAFTALPAGSYTLEVPEIGLKHGPIEVNGNNSVEVTLEVPPVAPGRWQVLVEAGGPGPGFSAVRCEVYGYRNLPVRLWADGWRGTVQQTGTKLEYGPYVCEFAPLGGGRYYVEPEGLGVRATVEVDGTRVFWVRFRPSTREAAPPEQPKVYDLYLWLAEMPSTPAEFEAVVAYAAHFAPEVGKNLAEARKARYVVILGNALSEAEENALRKAGCTLVPIPKPWEKALRRRLAEGKPIP